MGVRKIHRRGCPLPFSRIGLWHPNLGGWNDQGRDPVFAEIHNLMTRASQALVGSEGQGQFDTLTVLSMTGRALFFRFLIDRGIFGKKTCQKFAPI